MPIFLIVPAEVRPFCGNTYSGYSAIRKYISLCFLLSEYFLKCFRLFHANPFSVMRLSRLPLLPLPCFLSAFGYTICLPSDWVIPSIVFLQPVVCSLRFQQASKYLAGWQRCMAAPYVFPF